MRFKFVVPMKRSPHPPEYTARGVAMGVFWGITPLVGVQMYLVFMCWLAAKWHPKLNFHLLQGMLWVWVSNIFTLVPMYYGFYVTGQAMLGRFDDISGYGAFSGLLDTGAWEGASFWESMKQYFIYIADTFGLPLAIGWIPYAVIGAWVGYKATLRVVRARRARMQRRAEERRATLVAACAATDPHGAASKTHEVCTPAVPREAKRAS